MSIRRRIRQGVFDLAREDLALFLEENEEDLIRVFREEIERLDREIPEENLFIDVKMGPLGETIVRACLEALTRFLRKEGLELPEPEED